MGTFSSTDQELAQALIDLCQTHSYQKISIQALTKKVGLNRQTFYYHFDDKEELLKWIYLRDLEYLGPEMTLANWEEQVLLLLKAIRQKGVFYQKTTLGAADVFSQLFSKQIQQRFIDLFAHLDEERQLSAQDKDFYSTFFAFGCAGVLLKWIRGDYQEMPLEIAAQLFRLAKDVEWFGSRLYDE
ncbi:TetR/AcrR family transcriptional regulator [Enterococcus hirae]|nr:TetR/AcrR family transcriptional regulator [Enterococcus hirae]